MRNLNFNLTAARPVLPMYTASQSLHIEQDSSLDSLILQRSTLYQFQQQTSSKNICFSLFSILFRNWLFVGSFPIHLLFTILPSVAGTLAANNFLDFDINFEEDCLKISNQALVSQSSSWPKTKIIEKKSVLCLTFY